MKTVLGECRFELTLEARSTLFVQGALESGPPQKVLFFRAFDAVTRQERHCLPGSSLKGVWRSTAERILRSFDPALACDPFPQPEKQVSAARPAGGLPQACGQRLENSVHSGRYARQCPACRLFGSTGHAGLMRVNDAWEVEDYSTELQSGVALDRFTGGVGRGPFTTRPLPSSVKFSTTIILENFELWQVGLLALAWREMAEGWARAGSGTRKGRGDLRYRLEQVTVRYPHGRYNAAGGAGLCSAPALDGETSEHDALRLLPALQPRQPSGWRDRDWVTFDVPVDQHDAFLAGCVEQALAPRLREGRKGFGYVPLEADHA